MDVHFSGLLANFDLFTIVFSDEVLAIVSSSRGYNPFRIRACLVYLRVSKVVPSELLNIQSVCFESSRVAACVVVHFVCCL